MFLLYIIRAIFLDSPNRDCPREEKCNSPKIHICEIMELAGIFRKNKMKKPRSPKVSLLVLIGGEKQDSILLRQLRRLNGAYI